jgi:hypothetical protein
MKLGKRRALLALALTATSSPVQAGAGRVSSAPAPESRLHAFSPGEQSTYEVRYLGVAAGTAQITVGEPDEHHLWPIVAFAHSKPVLRFYPVHDKLVSLVDPVSTLAVTQHFEADENHQRREQEVTIDRDSSTARVTRRKGNDAPQHANVAIEPGTQDLGAAVFELRRRVRAVGQTLSIPVFTGARNIVMEAHVEGLERRDTALGPRDVFRVKVHTGFSGMLRSRGKDMFVYLTTDAARVPVRIEASMLLGSVVAELTDYKQGRALAAAEIATHD